MSLTHSLAGGLLKAKDSGDLEEMNDILDRLDEQDVTYNILKETKLGKICAGLRKHTDTNISNKAKALVLKWKQQVSQQKNPNNNSNPERRQARVSRNDNPPPPPAASSTSSVSRPHVSLVKGDSKRDKVIQKFALSLEPDVDDEKYLHWREVALEVEEALWDRFGSTGTYLKKFRDLLFNLKDSNNNLKQNLLVGSLSPTKLVTMSTEELASETLKAARNDERDWALKEAQGAAAIEQKAMTDDYKCGKCKQRKCTYYQQQTRGADEPMTTFIRCIVCGNQWKN